MRGENWFGGKTLFLQGSRYGTAQEIEIQMIVGKVNDGEERVSWRKILISELSKVVEKFSLS